MKTTLKEFFEQLKARKVRKTIAIYTSSGLTLLGVTNLFTSVYHLSPAIFDSILVLLVCGFPSACLLAWYHGGEAKQKILKREILLHSTFLIIAVVIILRIVIAPGPRLLHPSAKSIAVLPFKNLSDVKEDEYFSDGVTEDIITQLSKIENLQVISRTSVMKYKTANKTVQEIGQELNVGSVLEGSVRRAGDRVRIVGQLIDAGSDRHLWAETYDRQMKDIFAIQSEVAQSIAAALQATLSPSERKQIEKKSTENLDAYAYYLRGREYYYRYTHDDNERAIELFQKALTLDPQYALAYAGLGDTYERKGWNDSAIAASNRAISLDPNLAEGYKALGNARQSEGELRRALDLYHTAVKLNPNYASAVTNIGYANLLLGELDEAVKWFRKAVVLQPGFARWSSNIGVSYYSLGYDSLAAIWCSKAMELQPDFPLPYVILTYIHVHAGRYDKARETINKVLSFSPNESIGLDAAGDVALITGNYRQAKQCFEKLVKQMGPVSAAGIKLACALRKLGSQKQSDKILDSNIAAYATRFDELTEGSEVPYFIAAAYSMKGDAEQANRWFKKAIDLGYRDRRWPLIDPLIERIRTTDRFIQSMAELDKKIEQMRARLEQQGLTQ